MSHADDHEGTRRDFLYYATAGAGAVTAGAAVWPLVSQMNPSADVQALSSIRVDVAGVSPGTQLTVKWLGKPVFIRHRTGVEMEALTGCSVAALTVYDMCKALSHEIQITDLRLVEKTGGKSDFKAADTSADV